MKLLKVIVCMCGDEPLPRHNAELTPGEVCEVLRWEKLTRCIHVDEGCRT